MEQGQGGAGTGWSIPGVYTGQCIPGSTYSSLHYPGYTLLPSPQGLYVTAVSSVRAVCRKEALGSNLPAESG